MSLPRFCSLLLLPIGQQGKLIHQQPLVDSWSPKQPIKVYLKETTEEVPWDLQWRILEVEEHASVSSSMNFGQS